MHGPQTKAAEAIHAMKYRQTGETWRDAVNRVASALKDSDAHYHEFREIFGDMRFMPAGRVQAAIGSAKQVTPYNCFVSGAIEDSFVDGDGCIMQRATEAAMTMRMGGGIGYDFSTLRPKGALIKKLQSHSSGPVSFMNIFDAVCRATASSGHRRGAQMGVMRIDHPDIVEFINAKHDQENLSGFNMSVAVTDEFMEAAAAGKPFALRFGGVVYREVDARDLWEMLMRSTWDWAEPGVLFIDTINKMNNLWYCENIAATNPCVPAGTPILTRYGWQSIDSLVGSSVQVWNGYEWSAVVPKVTGFDQQLVKVNLSNGRSLTCTTSHRFVLADGSRVSASDLDVDDKLVKHDWPVVEAGAEVPDAYRRGFFVGDGWLSGERAYVGLYGAKRELVNELAVGSVSIRNYATTDGFAQKMDGETRTYIYLGRGTEYSKDDVPDCSWAVSSRLEWLAGLIDSDGCVVANPSPAIQISAKSKSFLSRVQLMLNTIGASATVAPMKDCWRLSISPSDVMALTEIGLHLRRVQLCGSKPNHSAARFVRVLSVEHLGVLADKVYCFTERLRNQGSFDGVVTGQCGEQPLPPYGACLLGSFNLVRYLSRQPVSVEAIRQGLGGPGYAFDWDQLKADIPHVVRAMDNIVDRARYPLPQQEREAKSKRRMGLGVMSLANAAEALGFAYGTKGFIEFEQRVLALIANESYRASAALAAEKGSFPLYDAERYGQSKFLACLDDDVCYDIASNGIRNSHLTSIAPTGTISMSCDNVSSGIEPVFAYKMDRPVNTQDGPVMMRLDDYGVRFLGVKGRLCDEVSVEEHVDVLVAASSWVDSAVSKTCNLGGATPWDDFKNLYLRAWQGGAKGCTTFNKNGKRFALMTAEDAPPASCQIDVETGLRDCAS